MNNRFTSAERRGTMILVVITFVLMLWLVIYKSCHSVSATPPPFVGDSVVEKVQNIRDTTIATPGKKTKRANKTTDKESQKKESKKDSKQSIRVVNRSPLDEPVN